MKLKRLIKDLSLAEVRGSKEVEITGICSHSKQVAPGNLFIAKKGRTVDGSSFIPEAVLAGAVAIATDFYDPTLKTVTQIIHPELSKIEGMLSAAFHHRPSDDLLMIGITGTNGKTTTSYLIKHLLDTLSIPCGLIGTIEYLIGGHRVQATHTTPDVAINHKLLKEMVNHGCKAAVMEVTSHALDQGRVSEIDYDVVIFTNLSPEHLDYHKTMEGYLEAKKHLFNGMSPTRKKRAFPKAALVNSDDTASARIMQGCRVPLITFGIENPAEVQASNIRLSAEGSQFDIAYAGRSYEVSLPLIGRFNVYNALAAIACGISQQLPIEQLIAAAKTCSPIPGRLEVVPNTLGLKIYVDFAHTPDALNKVLNCINEFSKGKIITVFGCGGDRDPYKRPKMAEISERYSVISVLTNDNPRSEDPHRIIEEVLQGFQNQRAVIVEPDRRLAIEKAIDLAAPGDSILIAGRGHEPYQTFARHSVEFDDTQVSQEICRLRAMDR